jgi:peptidoglycan/LPS O-acetylase OafA/YrhL
MSAISKLRTVEAGRGLAAVLVVLFHVTNYYFNTPKYWTGTGLNGLFLFGHAGVEFFFVLSGFIMVWVHSRDVGKPERAGQFVWKRFNRIYPFFWVVLAITLALVWRIPSIGRPFYRDPWVILQSFALVGQNPLHAVVFVSWTLWHEMVFYALCAAVIIAPRLGIPVFVMWTLACATNSLPSYVFGFINILFAFGVGVALALKAWTIPMPRIFLGVGVGLFLATAIAVDYTTYLPEWSTRVLFGGGAALALAGAIELERRGRLSPPGWSQVLGAASFSIYLTHILTLTFLAKIAVALHLNRWVPGPIAFVSLAFIAVLAGVAAHYLIERRVIAFASMLQRQLLSRGSSEPATVQ